MPVRDDHTDAPPVTPLAALTEDAWTTARLHACLPRRARFLSDTPRRRPRQAATVRAWLDTHPGRAAVPQQAAA